MKSNDSVMQCIHCGYRRHDATPATQSCTEERHRYGGCDPCQWCGEYFEHLRKCPDGPGAVRDLAPLSGADR